ncbi:MAG: hypothetical protein JW955_01520 [Sedimentisphaerales bacterium]|nr:hypothetical protein [Sedimentisphaerales bacterium]
MEDASDDAGGPEEPARELANLDPHTDVSQSKDDVCTPLPASQVRAAQTVMNRDEQDVTAKEKISVHQYLEEVARFCNSEYGCNVRRRFKDLRGTSELAMLAAPTPQELEELRRAVAIMTPSEKNAADRLSDEQIAKIAVDARVDPANLAIFLNGYALLCKRVS